MERSTGMGSNASISVNKETVKGYLESGKANPFLIPEYQRPYGPERGRFRVGRGRISFATTTYEKDPGP